MPTKKPPAAKRKRPRQSVRRPVPFATFIASLARDDIEVLKPIPVTLEPDDDGSFIASFLDANVASGGETVQDAVESLQDMLATSFNLLIDLPDTQLGPRMRRERTVLLEFLCRTSPKTTPKEPPES